MKNYAYVFLVLILTACTGDYKDNSNKTDIIESEIISNTIKDLTPDISEIRLIVPADGGEESSAYEKRKESFYKEHNRIIENDDAYFILSDNLTIPVQGERFLSINGLSRAFVRFLYHSAKEKPVNCQTIKNLYNFQVKKKTLNISDFSLLNKPGCYGYVEYSRMQFSENYSKAQFIFKYRLNNGMDFTQLVTVNKTGNKWEIENREDLLVSYETPDSPIEPTKIIDTVSAPTYSDDDFEVKFSTDIIPKNPLPRNVDITITVHQNAFDSDFLKYVDFDFSLNRSWNNLNMIEFNKVNDSTYKIKFDKCYPKDDIQYDVRVTPKRGYIYHDFLSASQSHRYVDHLRAASLSVYWKSMEKINLSNCK